MIYEYGYITTMDGREQTTILGQIGENEFQSKRQQIRDANDALDLLDEDDGGARTRHFIRLIEDAQGGE